MAGLMVHYEGLEVEEVWFGILESLAQKREGGGVDAAAYCEA